MTTESTPETQAPTEGETPDPAEAYAREVAGDVVLSLGESDPRDDCFDGLEALKAAGFEHLFCLHGDEIFEEVRVRLSNAFYDGEITLGRTPPAPSAGVELIVKADEWLCGFEHEFLENPSFDRSEWVHEFARMISPPAPADERVRAAFGEFWNDEKDLVGNVEHFVGQLESVFADLMRVRALEEENAILRRGATRNVLCGGCGARFSYITGIEERPDHQCPQAGEEVAG